MRYNQEILQRPKWYIDILHITADYSLDITKDDLCIVCATCFLNFIVFKMKLLFFPFSCFML